MNEIRFTVASELLRELGEALVGKAHIALAELVKNSYDADAKQVTIRIETDVIEISDNGHGMTLEQFGDFWMRIGSQHKRRTVASPGLSRPLTGSKGVGRLSAQFLGDGLELVTGTATGDRHLRAIVDWSEAVKAGELTEAVALWDYEPASELFPNSSRHGTLVRITGLRQSWTREALLDLAREIWWLQPPFGGGSEGFSVELKGAQPEAVQQFNEQMHAIANIWEARILGTNHSKSPEKVVIAVFHEGATKPLIREFDFPNLQPLPEVRFEIRVYALKRRQPHGIRVGEARDYLNRFGGVHIYDAGFHLPYYGPNHDWLNIEFDHARRVERSLLLPPDLQEAGGISFLPPNSRLLGSVQVDTGLERRKYDGTGDAGYLQVQISRDRLTENRAYEALKSIVRVSLDWYATLTAAEAHRQATAQAPIESTTQRIQKVEAVLDHFEPEIPKKVYQELRQQISASLASAEAAQQLRTAQMGLFGALATAGMSALAYEHEVGRQMRLLDHVATRVAKIAAAEPTHRDELLAIEGDLRSWLRRVRANRRLFLPLLGGDTVEDRKRYEAKPLIDEIVDQAQMLLRGIDVDTQDLPPTLRLPAGTFAEWSALVQNVLFNAANAMLDSAARRVRISGAQGRDSRVVFEDTGTGVDLDNADKLFDPFVQALRVSPERKALRIGGSGLGLTIVRMIADGIGCHVSFDAPSREFATAFVVSWRET